ncbi:MAG TPA: amidohydrolase family protein [Chloroflexota bacterium]
MKQRIDIHHHVVPPQFQANTPMPVAIPSTRQQLGNMSELDVQAAVTSITPRILDVNPGHIRSVVRTCNEYMAGMVRDHPTCFGAFAALPLPDVDGALEEIEYALDTLHMDGIGLFSNQGGRYLGDPAFDEIFAELSRREAVAFVHPAHCEAPEHTNLHAPDAIVEYVFDTTRAIVNLLYNGTLERCPDVRMIFSHGGGAAPFILSRINGLDGNPRSGTRDSMAAMRSLYYDTTSATQACTLRCLQELADVSHIVWGTDMPFLHGDRLRQEVHHWEIYDGFDAVARQAIERDNALRLLPSLAARLEL